MRQVVAAEGRLDARQRQVLHARWDVMDWTMVRAFRIVEDTIRRARHIALNRRGPPFPVLTTEQTSVSGQTTQRVKSLLGAAIPVAGLMGTRPG